MVQNLCVSICAVVVCLTLYLQDEISQIWEGWLTTICHILIILFAVVADLASVGRTISIERDWIVVICKDSTVLTGRWNNSQVGGITM